MQATSILRSLPAQPPAPATPTRTLNRPKSPLSKGSLLNSACLLWLSSVSCTLFYWPNSTTTSIKVATQAEAWLLSSLKRNTDCRICALGWGRKDLPSGSNDTRCISSFYELLQSEHSDAYWRVFRQLFFAIDRLFYTEKLVFYWLRNVTFEP